MRKTLRVGLIATFAALHSILYLLPYPLWRNWAVYMEPIEGIMLGPTAGFLAALIGSSIARAIMPSDFWMFGIAAESVGVLVSGLMAEGRWKCSMAVYALMLTAYFIHPFGRMLPLWTILDVLFAFLLIYPVAKIVKRSFEKKDVRRLPLALASISFVGVAADSLVRVFLLVPAGLHTLFFSGFEELFLIFTIGAIDSFIEDLITVFVSILVGVPLIATLWRIPSLRFPLVR